MRRHLLELVDLPQRALRKLQRVVEAALHAQHCASGIASASWSAREGLSHGTRTRMARTRARHAHGTRADPGAATGFDARAHATNYTTNYTRNSLMGAGASRG